MVLVSHVRPEQLVTAVPQGLEDQGEARPQGEAEPARALLVPAEDRQQDSLQRQAPPLAPHQAELLSCLCLPAAVLLRSGPCLFAAYPMAPRTCHMRSTPLAMPCCCADGPEMQSSEAEGEYGGWGTSGVDGRCLAGDSLPEEMRRT